MSHLEWRALTMFPVLLTWRERLLMKAIFTFRIYSNNITAGERQIIVDISQPEPPLVLYAIAVGVAFAAIGTTAFFVKKMEGNPKSVTAR